MKSISPRKQRNLRSNADLHTKRKFLGAHLSKELRKTHGIRSLPLKVGDSVKVMRGTHKKKTGVIERIETKKSKIFITGIEVSKIDGSKGLVGFEPSNLLIETFDTKDKKRIKGKK